MESNKLRIEKQKSIIIGDYEELPSFCKFKKLGDMTVINSLYIYYDYVDKWLSWTVGIE